MKVLQLTVHFSPNVGGVETHLSDLVAGLIKRNFKVFVLAYRPLMIKAPWQVLEKSKNLTILRLPWLPGFFYKLVGQPALEFLYLTPGLFLVAPFVLIKERPNVIHAHGLIAGFVGVFWGKIFGIRTVVSTHSIYDFPKSGMYYLLAKFIFGNASKTICLSNQSVKEIQRLGVSDEKIGRFTYWIDLDIFSRVVKARDSLGWKDGFIVFFVGRLVEIKGVRELLEASKLFNKSIKLVIAGDGPLRDEVQSFANSSSGRVLFLNRIDNTKLPTYYSGADVLIVPSTHEEGFGRVILEALACGTPVIGSRRGAIPEAMDESVGRLIDVTPENIAQVINELPKKPKLIKSWGTQARKLAVSRFSEKNIDEIINSYIVSNDSSTE